MSNKHLSLSDRYHIYYNHARGVCIRQIAQDLGRHRSTIYKELKRNAGKRSYRPEQAHRLATARQTNTNTNNQRRIAPVVERAVRRLLIWFQWSPEQISGWLATKGYDTVSHEWIYQMVWADKKRGGDLYTHLRHRGKKYNKRAHANKRRGVIPNKRDITERPVIVEEKSRIGDFELDTVIGANHKGALVTIVDRHSKLTKIIPIKHKTKDLTRQAIHQALFALKTHVHTLTSDNGTEFADHQKIARMLKADFFFAKPYHSWERGLNEHTNGLIRQYFPKGTNFHALNNNDIKHVEKLLNNRPRKILNYKTPNQVWKQMTQNQ